MIRAFHANWSRPIRTFNTAVTYYHKFRLVHPDNEYNYLVFAPLLLSLLVVNLTRLRMLLLLRCLPRARLKTPSRSPGRLFALLTTLNYPRLNIWPRTIR